MEWEFCSKIPLSAESRYQCRRTFTRGHYNIKISLTYEVTAHRLDTSGQGI